MKVTVATCQFPVSADLRSNALYILKQMRVAKKRGAHIAHFCEGSLSGYWILLGSSHPLSGRRKPHNSVYIINNRGEIIDRYDKMFCSGDRLGKKGDLAHYSPGNYS